MQLHLIKRKAFNYKILHTPHNATFEVTIRSTFPLTISLGLLLSGNPCSSPMHFLNHSLIQWLAMFIGFSFCIPRCNLSTKYLLQYSFLIDFFWRCQLSYVSTVGVRGELKVPISRQAAAASW